MEKNTEEIITEKPADPEEEAEKLFVRVLRFQRIININMVRLFFAVLISVSLIALIPFLRPSFSVTEKRELHKFPEFSFGALFSGSYFDDIGLWYSDTFPGRDSFVSANAALNNLFGIKGVEIYGDVTDTDALPDGEAVPADPGAGDSGGNGGSGSNPPAVVEKIGTLAIVGNSGYEYYNFGKETADMYASAISRAADKLAGKCRVVNTVVPTGIAITLDKKTAAQMNSSDQKTAIDYIYSNISKNAICVDSYGILSKHKDEYLYFRTDHHWTSLAAYYSYSKLIEAVGKPPADLSLFREYVFGGFLGTFYTTSGMSTKLGATPDTVYAYEPPGLEYIHTYEQGFEKDYHIVSDANRLKPSEKYLTFICGDHPLGYIVNDQIAEDSACLIIKESFGNPMPAYFTQNYRVVFVIDIRKIHSVYSGSLESFALEHGIGDIYFINNISATRNKQIIECLSDFIGQ